MIIFCAVDPNTYEPRVGLKIMLNGTWWCVATFPMSKKDLVYKLFE